MKGRIRSVPDLARVLNRFGRRSPTLALCAVVLCGLMWEGAGAAPPHRSHPAHRQVRSLASSFPRTEVDQAMGAYVPGVGAVITFQVVRGPNTVRGKSAFDGVLDWLVHIMSTRASKLDAVPADETISLSADFFEYGVEVYHQIALVVRAGDAADPSRYRAWLNGTLYEEEVAQILAQRATGADASGSLSSGSGFGVSTTLSPATGASGSTSAAGPRAGAPALATRAPGSAAGAGATSGSGGTTARPEATRVPGQLAELPTTRFVPIASGVVLDFEDPRASARDWSPVSGRWVFSDGAQVQSELGRFDLLTMYSRRLAATGGAQVEMRLLQGEMGGGLVFNAPARNSRRGAQMISFAGNGTFLQWGFFDRSGVFQFQGGVDGVNGGNGEQHTLAFRINGNTYEVAINGVQLMKDIPLASPAGGYFGLLASTSQVAFDNLRIEGLVP